LHTGVKMKLLLLLVIVFHIGSTTPVGNGTELERSKRGILYCNFAIVNAWAQGSCDGVARSAADLWFGRLRTPECKVKAVKAGWKCMVASLPPVKECCYEFLLWIWAKFDCDEDDEGNLESLEKPLFCKER